MLVSPKTLTLPLLSPSYSATFPFGRPEEVLKDKDRERDKDREKRALLSDAELNAIRRNATQVLELHETLFSMLLDAVRASGWVPGLNALEGSELGSEAALADTDTDNEQRFESALRSVASLFTAQVSKNFFFVLSEVLCLRAFISGHFRMVSSCSHFMEGCDVQRVRGILCRTPCRDRDCEKPST